MTRPLRIMSIAGTRPEAIKFAPLVRLLCCREGIEHIFVATGQHGALFHATLDPFGVTPDIDLALENASIDGFCAALAAALPVLFGSFAPDLVLVQGDTSSAWAAALTAHARDIAVGHVEAGLRSGDPDLPWPEERNRQRIDRISTLLFAPSQEAAANLAGLPGRIHVTGNTGIDAMMWMSRHRPPTLRDVSRPAGEAGILVTCHRRESIPYLPALVDALAHLAERPGVVVRFPVHPNPQVRAAIARHPPRGERLRLIAPLSYPELLREMDEAHLLITDSGGLQEEAPAIGLPTLVLRTVTERPEPVASGNARLVGLDAGRMLAEAIRLLDDPAAHAAMARRSFPYGRGDAAVAIVAAIEAWARDSGGAAR